MTLYVFRSISLNKLSKLSLFVVLTNEHSTHICESIFWISYYGNFIYNTIGVTKSKIILPVIFYWIDVYSVLIPFLCATIRILRKYIDWKVNIDTKIIIWSYETLFPYISEYIIHMIWLVLSVVLFIMKGTQQ